MVRNTSFSESNAHVDVRVALATHVADFFHPDLMEYVEEVYNESLRTPDTQVRQYTRTGAASVEHCGCTE